MIIQNHFLGIKGGSVSLFILKEGKAAISKVVGKE